MQKIRSAEEKIRTKTKKPQNCFCGKQPWFYWLCVNYSVVFFSSFKSFKLMIDLITPRVRVLRALCTINNTGLKNVQQGLKFFLFFFIFFSQRREAAKA